MFQYVTLTGSQGMEAIHARSENSSESAASYSG